MPWDERWAQLVLQRCQGTGARNILASVARRSYRRTMCTGDGRFLERSTAGIKRGGCCAPGSCHPVSALWEVVSDHAWLVLAGESRQSVSFVSGRAATEVAKQAWSSRRTPLFVHAPICMRCRA